MLSFFFFFLLVMFCALPSSVCSLLGSASVVGFSGSRSVCPPAGLVASVAGCVSPVASVSVGCAPASDLAFRVAFPSASVFFASSFGSGRGSFARRSVACVGSVAGVAGGLWVSFPAVACPAGLLPSASSSACFCGSGSGSWGSLAFAVGSGVRSLVWLPVGVFPPAGWGFVPLGLGWWVCG